MRKPADIAKAAHTPDIGRLHTKHRSFAHQRTLDTSRAHAPYAYPTHMGISNSELTP